MTRRYFSAAPIDGPRVTLADAEAHHLLHVLRATPGTTVVLFDGSGQEFDAEVLSCGRSTVDLAVGPGKTVDRELPFPLTLGVALPKGDRQRWIVEKAVELGVSRLVPLETEHSEGNERRAAEKLGRYVIEASKQCGRNRLMAIAEPVTWADWLALPSQVAIPPEPRRWIAHPSGQPQVLADLAGAAPTFAAVGPEGGFTDAEIAAARAAGWTIVGLGPRVLRIETAAIALAALAAASR